MRLFTTVALFLTVTSCTTQAEYPEEVMYDIASILKDISQAVDGELKYEDTTGLTSEEVINNATASIPDQLAKLPKLAVEGNVSRYRIVSEFQGNNAVMLICDGDVALMEDVGCNTEFDNIYWHAPQPNTCTIRLDAAAICGH
ncbi:hypothetical protein [Photobacterium sp. 1_MG-2023]|uniref:hypothetical protein n=1 Tax=Photobacterium sp. 1_MG-2023 TaxID=3062646 RepID=UPI0026E19527|nr:hypothetical protein [Photobacterium sp. 1_MG-2023]MDO6706949.1 hypothetical protein [Photobacterium sp. 1_MG-2023]